MMVGEVGIYTYNYTRTYIYILYNYLYPVMTTGINGNNGVKNAGCILYELNQRINW